MPKIKVTTWIIIALFLGVAVGFTLDQYILPGPIGSAEEIAAAEALRARIAGYFSVLSTTFLRMIKMIIAPLVFSTLVVGIAGMGSMQAVGRIGLKTFVWFVGASIVSIFVGLFFVNLLKPGQYFDPSILHAVKAEETLAPMRFTLEGFMAEIIPQSIAEAMSNNAILQIVVFALFFGIACASVGPRARRLVAIIEDLSHVMIKMTSFVMNFAPFAVFGAIAALVTREGVGPLLSLGIFIGEFYFSLAMLWILMGVVASLFVGRRVFRLVELLKINQTQGLHGWITTSPCPTGFVKTR